MTVLAPLLLVLLGVPASVAERCPGAEPVFACPFDAKWDENFDRWPDNWTRARGPKYPHYVNIRVVNEAWPGGDRSLRVDLDGGAAAVSSPEVPVDPRFAHVLEAWVKTESLRHDRAYLSLAILDRNGQRLETFHSAKIQSTHGWGKVRLGPVATDRASAAAAVIGLHVEPGTSEDLKGTVAFADVWLGRLPRMRVQANRADNLFLTGSPPIEITCTLSGLPRQPAAVKFELQDAWGCSLGQTRQPLEARGHKSAIQTAWKPPVATPGFYRVRTTLEYGRTTIQARELSLAVVEPAAPPGGGQFAWSLSRLAKRLPQDQLQQLIVQSGVSRVKIPLWRGKPRKGEPADQADRKTDFVEWLNERGIDVVGVLAGGPDRPPLPPGEGRGEEELQSASATQGETSQVPVTPYPSLEGKTPPSAAETFAADPKTWVPMVEPVLLRYAGLVRWWQLGDDRDRSFVGDARLLARLAPIQAELDRLGQGVSLGVNWTWTRTPLPAAVQFVTLSADPPLTAAELPRYLRDLKPGGPERWVEIAPLSAASYTTEVRVRDLVQRIVAAKAAGAATVVCPEPIGGEQGLVHADGTPGELLLPWRTTALALDGTAYLGSLQLPHGSPNQVFARGSEGIMVVWNDHPTDEEIYLGDRLRQTDVWGRTTASEGTPEHPTLHVDRMPTFVFGLSVPLVRWRLNCALGATKTAAVFGQPQQNSLRVKNPFGVAVVGQARVVAPRGWVVEPAQLVFRVPPGQQQELPLAVSLPYNTDSGRQPVRIDFDVEADRPLHFSVYRSIDVGLGDVTIDINAQRNSRGELEVQQRLVNATDGAVSFRCELFAPGRRRQTTQILDLPRGDDVKTYRIPYARDLMGKTLWLHAEEIGGPRVLNYRFVVP